MRIATLLLFYFISANVALGQDFLLKLYFEDFVGNKDTIEFGLNPEATNGIDEQFGEVNIIEKAYQDGLDVRIMNRWIQFTLGESTSYHTKKQVVPRQFEIYNIIVNTEHFPVTASWDNQTIISNDSVSGSIITSIYPGGWFDTGSPSDLGTVLLRSRSTVTFTSNLEEEIYSEEFGYILRDTIPTYWFTFAPADFLMSSTDEIKKEQFKVYPNPTKGQISIENKNSKSVKYSILYNFKGQIIEVFDKSELDLTELDSGIYFLNIITKEGESIVKKIMKQ